MNQSYEEKSILKVGEVCEVSGRVLQIKVDHDKNSTSLIFRGDLIKNIAVDSYIKVTKGFIDLIGIVDGEYIVEEKRDLKYSDVPVEVSRRIKVSLLGYLEKESFHRGITEMPLVGNFAYLITKKEFALIHKLYSEDEKKVTLGHLASDIRSQIDLGVNNLFSGHIGIFGNTGSGKSYTLAKLYQQYIPKFQEINENRRAKFVLIDFNGEYIDNSIIQEKKNVKRSIVLNTHKDEKNDSNKLHFPKEVLEDSFFWSRLLDATEKTQVPFIKNVCQSIGEKKDIKDFIRKVFENILKKNDPKLGINAIQEFIYELEGCINNTPLLEWFNGIGFHTGQNSYYLISLWNEGTHEKAKTHDNLMNNFPQIKIQEEQQQSDFRDFYLRFIAHYYNGLAKGYFNAEHIKPLLKRFQKRVKDLEKTIAISDNPQKDYLLTVISLKDVNIDMKKMLPLLICRDLYDQQKDLSQSSYLNIIIDEAHNILSYDSKRESEEWRDYRLETFEEIVKEGRKFNTFLTIASQRPSDISHTIISQIHTFFLHRLINDRDIEAVKNTISYLSTTQFENLSSLPTGHCIIAGYKLSFPMTLKISQLSNGEESKPNSDTLDIDKFLKN